jgi:hypothetical protein
MSRKSVAPTGLLIQLRRATIFLPLAAEVFIFCEIDLVNPFIIEIISKITR